MKAVSFVQPIRTLILILCSSLFDVLLLQTVSALIDQNKESDILSVLPLMVATGRTEELLQLLCARNFHKEAAAVGLTTLTRDHPAVKVSSCCMHHFAVDKIIAPISFPIKSKN